MLLWLLLLWLLFGAMSIGSNGCVPGRPISSGCVLLDRLILFVAIAAATTLAVLIGGVDTVC